MYNVGFYKNLTKEFNYKLQNRPKNIYFQAETEYPKIGTSYTLAFCYRGAGDAPKTTFAPKIFENNRKNNRNNSLLF